MDPLDFRATRRMMEKGGRRRAVSLLLWAPIVGWALASVPLATPLPLASQSPESSPVDSISLELDRGWHWKARELLWRRYGTEPAEAGARLQLAEAEAGLLNWIQVRDLLDDADWVSASGIQDDPEREWDRLYWIGRALEEQGWGEDAAEVFTHLRTLDAVGRETRLDELRLRQIRALAGLERWPEALAQLRELSPSRSITGSWMALDGVRAAAAQGDTARVSEWTAFLLTEATRTQSWESPAVGFLNAGDTVRAIAAYEAQRFRADGTSRSAAQVTLADLHLLRDDPRSAWGPLLTVLRDPTSGTWRVRAAQRIDDAYDLDAEGTDLRRDDWITLARLLSQAGRGHRSLQIYDRAFEEFDPSSPPSDALELERARVRFSAGRIAEAEATFESLSRSTDSDIAVAAIEARIRASRGRGASGEIQRLQAELVERFPEHPASVDVIFFRGDAAHDRGDRGGAIARYDEVVSMSPNLDRAGLAAMRLGQLHLTENDPQSAARVFESYLEAFPEGRRWEEASYWAAESYRRMGDDVRDESLLNRIVEQSPTSYYAMLASERLGGGPLLAVAADPSAPVNLTGSMWELVEELDLALALELDGAVRETIDALRTAASGSRELRIRLAEELNVRGRTIEGIGIGQALVRDGYPLTRRLLRVLYPLPKESLIRAVADDLDLDLYLMVGLMRQESAFVPDIRSPAGAVGMMQLMPATARSLARTVGLDPLRNEQLEVPGINVHLGAMFFSDMLDRFGPELPFILSAYNAGPTRMARWRSFDEVDEPLRFTERIPYRETRDYVKIVRRNRWLYESLYSNVF